MGAGECIECKRPGCPGNRITFDPDNGMVSMRLQHHKTQREGTIQRDLNADVYHPELAKVGQLYVEHARKVILQNVFSLTISISKLRNLFLTLQTMSIIFAQLNLYELYLFNNQLLQILHGAVADQSPYLFLVREGLEYYRGQLRWHKVIGEDAMSAARLVNAATKLHIGHTIK